jgi:hypothetical protein
VPDVERLVVVLRAKRFDHGFKSARGPLDCKPGAAPASQGRVRRNEGGDVCRRSRLVFEARDDGE